MDERRKRSRTNGGAGGADGPRGWVGGREWEALRPRLPVAREKEGQAPHRGRPENAWPLRCFSQALAWAPWDGKAGTGRCGQGDRGSRFSAGWVEGSWMKLVYRKKVPSE